MWTHYLRDYEIKEMLKYLDNSMDILEIGSGDGYIANELKKKGFRIIATDPSPRYPSFYKVEKINALELPYKKESFDAIISSNVLEHIEQLDNALAEMRRVLKKGGIMVHTVPTIWTNLFTVLTQPLIYLKSLYYLITFKVNFESKHRFRKAAITKQIFLKYNPIRIIIGPGHGTSSRVMAFYRWRQKHWKKIFNQNDLKIKKIVRVPIRYSMNKSFPYKFMKFRKSSKMGCIDIYILTKI